MKGTWLVTNPRALYPSKIADMIEGQCIKVRAVEYDRPKIDMDEHVFVFLLRNPAQTALTPVVNLFPNFRSPPKSYL